MINTGHFFLQTLFLNLDVNIFFSLAKEPSGLFPALTWAQLTQFVVSMCPSVSEMTNYIDSISRNVFLFIINHILN